MRLAVLRAEIGMLAWETSAAREMRLAQYRIQRDLSRTPYDGIDRGVATRFAGPEAETFGADRGWTYLNLPLPRQFLHEESREEWRRDYLGEFIRRPPTRTG